MLSWYTGYPVHVDLGTLELWTSKEGVSRRRGWLQKHEEKFCLGYTEFETMMHPKRMPVWDWTEGERWGRKDKLGVTSVLMR